MSRWLHWLPLRFRSLVHGAQVDAELDEELRDHLDRQMQALLEKGLPPNEARRMALIALGGLDQQKEACRDARGTQAIEHVVRDLRYAVRVLRRSPGFTAVAILSLALGIGANTAIFQLIDAIRLRSLPVPDPHELAEVRVAGGHGGLGSTNGFGAELTNPIWEQIRDHRDPFAGAFAWGATEFMVGRGAQTRFVDGLWVSGEFFPVLRIVPARGRLFTADDDRRGCGARSMVVSYAFWQSYFGGAESAIGSTVTMLGQPLEVVGITPPEFFGLETGKHFDVVLPLCAAAVWSNSLDARHIWWLSVMGRLRDGWTLARATDYFQRISGGVFEATMPQGYEAASNEKYRKFRLVAEPAANGISRLRFAYERSLWLLLVITGLVLLIACANIANLMLARAGARGREIAVRAAIGASRGRILLQLLSESVVLAAAGATLGIFLAAFLSRSVIAFLSTGSDTLHLDVGFDWRVFAFTAAAALVTCAVCGLAPALRSAHIAPGAAMSAGGGSTTAGCDLVLGRRVLVVAQVAVSLVLLVTAVLFVRSFRNLITAETGLRREGVVFAYLLPVRAPQGDRSQWVHATHAALLERIRSISQVDAAAFSSQFPLNGASWTQGVRVPVAGEDQRGSSKFTYVTPDYFRTMDIRMLAGRDVNEFDTASSRKVLVVNEVFARRFFGQPYASVLGRPVRSVAEPGYPEAIYEVVGVVTDTKYSDLRDEMPAIAYVPLVQHPSLRSLKGLVFRTAAPLAPVLAEVRRRVALVNPDIAIDFKVFETEIRERLVREQLMAWLAGFFGALAAVLATIGLYGVVSYMVVNRRGEIGIRLALGATGADIVRLMLAETALLLSIGLAAGALLCIPVARSAAVLLFGISPHDTATLVIAAAALALTAGLAGYVPARRAARVDPMLALRAE